MNEKARNRFLIAATVLTIAALGVGLYILIATSGYSQQKGIQREPTAPLNTPIPNRFPFEMTTADGYFPQAIIYQEPPNISDAFIAERFPLVIQARRQLDSDLPGYKNAGWDGLALQYFDTPWLNGPTSMENQSTPCTPSQRSTYVWANSITMTGAEFCDLHDAIVSNTPLPEFPQLQPTEDWFLHSLNGSRISRSLGGADFTQYRMNLGHPDVQTWYILVAQRELDGRHGDATANGVYWDDIRDNPPASVEYPLPATWEEAVMDFLQAMYEGLGVPSWGNMNHADDFLVPAMDYLDGALIEVWGINWDGSPYSLNEQARQLNRVDEAGKPVVLMVQGETDQRYHQYTLGLAYLVDNWSYFYYSGGFTYLDIPEYEDKLGNPLGKRYEVSTGVWKRDYENGSVTVDMKKKDAMITLK